MIGWELLEELSALADDETKIDWLDQEIYIHVMKPTISEFYHVRNLNTSQDHLSGNAGIFLTTKENKPL